MIRLYIGTELASIGDDAPVLINYSMTDVDSPAVIQNSYTRSLALPRDDNNERIFGHMGSLDRTQAYNGNSTGPGFNPSYKTNFTLFVDGEVYQTGYLKIDSIDKDNFNVTLYGGLGDFLYNLSYKQDTEDDKMTLADLQYTPDGGEDELSFTINSDTVNSAWETLTSSTPDNYSIINFITSYEGLPDGLDSDKVLINTNGSSELSSMTLSKTDQGKVYESDNGFVRATLPGQITSWESRDLRSWTLRPAIKLSKVIEACCNPVNNGGYQVNIDSGFTSSGNPYWNKTYLTLPRLTEIDWEGDKASLRRQASIELPLESFSGRVSEHEIQIQSGDTLYYGGSDSKTQLTFDVSFTDVANSGTPAFYTSAARFRDFTTMKQTKALYRSIYIQLLAYSGSTVVAASDTVELTSRVPDKAAYSRGEERSYKIGDESLYAMTGTTNAYQPEGGDSTIRRSIGYFNNTGNGLFKWKGEDDSRSGDLYTPITLSINGSQVFTSLAIRITKAGIDYDEKFKTPQTYDYVFTQASVSRNDLGYGTYTNIPLSLVHLQNPSVTFSYGQTVRTGTYITKNRLLNGQHTPAEYLISFVKLFGLYIYKHPDEKVIDILKRDNFFINTKKDIEEVIDIDSFEITPLTFSNKWLDFGLQTVEGRYMDDYNSTSQVPYGTRRVNTGYDFNSKPLDVLSGNCYKTAVEVLDKSRLYTQVSDSILPGYFAGGIDYELRNGDDTVTTTYDERTARNSFQGGDYYDVFPKLQMCNADLSQTDGRDVIVFFDGWEGGTTQDDKPVYYIVSDDTEEMLRLNDGNPCWLWSETSTYDGRTLCHRYNFIPRFSRFMTSGGGLTYTLEMAIPRQLYFNNVVARKSLSTVYDRFWMNYVRDMYDVDTRKVSARVRFLERPDEDTMRKFYWFQNALWRINQITEYNPDSNDLTSIELIKVNDIQNYTTNQEPAPLEPVIPRLRLDCPMNSIKDTGSTRQILVDSNMQWTASTDIGTLDITTGTGTTYITLTVPRWWEVNPSGNTREITVTATGSVSGFSDSLVFTQRLWEPSVTATPKLFFVSGSGGSVTSRFRIDNWDNEIFDVMPGQGPLSTSVDFEQVNNWTFDVNIKVYQGNAWTGDTLEYNYYTAGLFRSTQSQPWFYADDTVLVYQFPYEYVLTRTGYSTLDPSNPITINIPHRNGVAIYPKLVSYPSWAQVTMIKGLTGTTFEITADENTSYEREGEIRFLSTDGSDCLVSLRQLGAHIINPARRSRAQRHGDGFAYPKSLELKYPASSEALRVDVEDMGYDSEWSISCDEEWVSIDATSGVGDGYFIVTVDDNDTGEPRNAYISFTSRNEQTLIIVHQSDVDGGGGSGGALWVEPKRFNFSYDAATTSATVFCLMGNWTATTSENWIIIPNTTGGTGQTTLYLSILQNSGSTQRSGTITITGDWGTARIAIKQDIFNIELEVVPDTLDFEYSGGTSGFTITTNTDWSCN